MRFEPPANARAKAARPVLVPGWAGQVKAIGGRVPPPAVGDGPVMLAVAVNGVPVPGEPDLWPGDDVTIHAAGASGAAAGIVLGDCGGWTTASTVRDNADRTQDISFTVGSGDAAIPIGDPVGHGTLLLRRGALRSPAIPVTLHAQMAHLVLAASVGPRVAQPSGTRLFSGNPLGLVEGVNTYTHLPPDDRTQFIGPDYSGTDTFGSDLHLIHGFTARASVRVLYNDYGRAVVLHGPSGRDFVTTVMWTVGGSFLDTSTVGYEVSWDLVGPAYGRPLSSIASTARTSCDLAWPIWQRGDGFSYAPSQRF